MPDMTPVNSKALKNIGYDQGAGKLVVEYTSGGMYEFDASPDEYQQVMAAESKGKAFAGIFGKRKGKKL